MASPCAWQPIDTAPHDGTALLLFHPEWDTLLVGLHYAETAGWQSSCGDLLDEPTHWMPLPPPPQVQPVLRPAA